MPGRIELLSKNTSFKVSLGLIIFILLIGTIGPMLVRNPENYVGRRYESPSWKCKMGTDVFGRDVWAQMTYGVRHSVIIGLLAGSIALMISFFVGGVGGYEGGLVDEGLNIVSNAFLTIPVIPVLIVLAVLFEHRSLFLVAFIVAVIVWPGPARSIRSQVLSLKERNFVDLARISGKGDSNILFMEIFPNMLGYVFIQFCAIFGTAVMMEAGISLLGLGPTTVTTLGSMLHWSIMNQAAQLGAWWWFIPPGLIVILLTGGLVLIGSEIDDVLNPKLRGRI